MYSDKNTTAVAQGKVSSHIRSSVDGVLQNLYPRMLRRKLFGHLEGVIGALVINNDNFNIFPGLLQQ